MHTSRPHPCRSAYMQSCTAEDLHSRVFPNGQKTATTLGRSKIGSRHEGQEVGATVGVCDGYREPGTSAPERISSGREPYSERQTAIQMAAVRPRACHARGDREAPGTPSAPQGRLHRQARHHPGLVSEADRPEVRRLPAPSLPRPAQGRTQTRSAGGPDGTGKFRVGL
jgi:hypothetical protein